MSYKIFPKKLSEIFCSIKFRFFLATILIVPVFLFISFVNTYKNKGVEDKFKNIANIYSDYDSSKLTHRLVKSDEANGIVTINEARIAYGAINDFLSKVKDVCKPDDTTENFLRCANEVLGDNFYYKEANTVAHAYANHYSDCDLNVYLLFDAAKIFNKKIEIVYAPRHAFVSFISEKYGARFYWETTDNENKGALAELTRPFYSKSINHFYYSPMDERSIEKVYSILSIADVDKGKMDVLLNSIDKSMMDNPFYLDFYYSSKKDKKKLEQKDAYTLYGLIQDDVSSMDKRLILSKYLLEHEQKNSAVNIINQIDDGVCDLQCMKVKKEISAIDEVYYYIMKAFKWCNADVPLAIVKEFFLTLLYLYLLVGTFFFGIIVQKEYNKNQHANVNKK
ncbi:hypothetical protein QL374_001202 [Salmonella enterica]|nr:hypothetical protein [Salmonella enterica]ELW6560984.1 hypothetical protein [Salmonella enterica]ELZ1401917.1 hypothetical protein [Salmonella enterica]